MRRPLIALTVSYILIIALLETLGVLDKIPAKNIARQATGGTAKITGRIISEPEETNNKISFILKAEKINDSPAEGRILVNVYADEPNVSYGDIVDAGGIFFRPEPPTVPGAFDYKKYLFRKRIYAILSVATAENIKILGRKPSYFWQLSLTLRRQILDSYSKNLLPQQAAVLSGITIGEKSGLTPYIHKIFVDAGVMYVLVVSGLHVAFVAAIFYWIFTNILRLRKKIAMCLFVPILLIYTIITGANPPVLRATIMTLIVISALLLARNADVYQGIFSAALIMLVYNPLTLFEAGFQMSFAATLGIIYLFPKFRSASKIHKLPKFFNWLLSAFFVSLSAQIAIAPLMAYYFNKVSIIALVSNLAIVPLIGLALDAGLLLYFTGLVGTRLLPIVAKLTGGLVSLITYLVDVFANVPHSTVRTPTPSVYFIMLFYLIVAGLPKIKNYVWKRVVIISLVIMILIPVRNYFFRNRKNLSLTFLDVGLGDSVFCEFPDGSNMLIDGGGRWNSNYDIGETAISPFLWNKGCTKLDTVVLTHPHLNHYRGLIAVCRNFSVKRFVTTPEVSSEKEYLDLMEVLRDEKIPVERVGSGKKFESGKVKMVVLNPDKISRDSDDNSLVLRLTYLDFSALFCGDITKKIQNGLLGENTASDFLLVPGHGKKLLLTDFLLKTAPEYAIISTDEPSQKVIEQLNWCKLFTTAGSGTLIVETDGKTSRITETLKDIPMDMIILNLE